MRAPGTWPVARLVRTSSDSPSPTLTDCSIHDGAATSPVLAKQLLSDRSGHAGPDPGEPPERAVPRLQGPREPGQVVVRAYANH